MVYMGWRLGAANIKPAPGGQWAGYTTECTDTTLAVDVFDTEIEQIADV